METYSYFVYVHMADYDTLEFFLTLNESLTFARKMDLAGQSVTVEIHHMDVAEDILDEAQKVQKTSANRFA